jgi:predicted glycoside hydrolase/deacetylase ChbG (UPF0249 family)
LNARRAALCADDYGYNAAVDEGILALIDRGRLGGASCMVEAPRFRDAAGALRERAARIDVGLHLNLTESFAGAARIGSLPQVLASAWLRLLGAAAVAQRLQRQLESFEHAFGRAPDYVDGHQHVHQFPVIRDVLLQVLESRYAGRRPLIRNTASAARQSKARVLAWLGGTTLQRELQRRDWPTNRDFVGAYRFEPGTDFAALAARWVRTLKDGAIWMCHPATRAVPGDPIGAYRVAEFQWFASADVDAAGRAAGVEWVRPRALSAGPD